MELGSVGFEQASVTMYFVLVSNCRLACSAFLNSQHRDLEILWVMSGCVTNPNCNQPDCHSENFRTLRAHIIPSSMSPISFAFWKIGIFVQSMRHSVLTFLMTKESSPNRHCNMGTQGILTKRRNVRNTTVRS